MESASAVEHHSGSSSVTTHDEDDIQGDPCLNQFTNPDLGNISTDSDTIHASQEEDLSSPCQSSPDPAQKGQHVGPYRSKEEYRRAVDEVKLILQSLIFAVLFPLVMWCSRAQLLLMVWRFNLMVCLYMYQWASIFSVTRHMFCYISCGALLAFWAGAVLSPAVGVLIINFNSVLCAILLGYALSKNRESHGIKKGAEATAHNEHAQDQGKEEEFPPVGKPVILTMILALLLPFVLWYHSSQPLLVVWRLSLLLCLGMVIWAQMFFAATRLSFCVSYGALLAFVVDAILSPVFGVMTVYLNSVYAAGLFGYSCAEHHESIGKEKATTLAVSLMPVNEEERYEQARMRSACSIICLLALGCTLRMAWVVYNLAEYQMQEVVINLSHVLFLFLVFAICFVLQFLHGAILGDQAISLLHLCSAFMAMIAVSCLLLGLYPHLMAMWIIVLALASILGYSLRVHTSYVQLRYQQMC